MFSTWHKPMPVRMKAYATASHHWLTTSHVRRVSSATMIIITEKASVVLARCPSVHDDMLVRWSHCVPLKAHAQ
jgi:hypothetical protein